MKVILGTSPNMRPTFQFTHKHSKSANQQRFYNERCVGLGKVSHGDKGFSFVGNNFLWKAGELSERREKTRETDKENSREIQRWRIENRAENIVFRHRCCTLWFLPKTRVCKSWRPIFYHLNGCKVSCPGHIIQGNRCLMAMTGIYISLNFFTDWMSNGKSFSK